MLEHVALIKDRNCRALVGAFLDDARISEDLKAHVIPANSGSGQAPRVGSEIFPFKK